MNAYLYINESDVNVMNKDLKQEKPITIHFKEDSPIDEPILYISRNINMKNFNYIRIPDFHRYFYIDKVDTSQQYYIVRCSSDPLMSFKSELKPKKVLLDRSATNYYADLEDDKAKLFQFTHTDVYRFPKQGFNPHIQEFLLTCCGNPDVNANVTPGGGGGGKVNNGGSTINNNNMNQEDYDNLSPEEKNDGTITIIPTSPVGSPSFENPSIFSNIKPSQYEALTTEQKNNGTFYYLSDTANGVTGNRIIKIEKTMYNELKTKAKNNNAVYYIGG